MSERGEVEVILPLVAWPTTSVETGRLLKMAFGEARKLVLPTGGEIIGAVSVTRGVAPDGDVAMKVRFAVNVPEQYLTRPKVFAL